MSATATASSTDGSRTVPMEILSLGPSRTATASMAEAYEVLASEGAVWERAADAKFNSVGKPLTREEWDTELFGEFGALTDLCAYFWEELLAVYPEAKVVLVERDIDAWYRSFTDGVLSGLYNSRVDFIIDYIEATVGPRTATASRKIFGGYFGTGGGPDQDAVVRRLAKERYREHFRRIREVVPSERLLDYELGSGWGPLCKFLGKEVPALPFPKVNESEILKARVREATMKTLRNGLAKLATYVAAPVAVVGLAWYMTTAS